MIGRAALGNPWLFQAVENLIEHNSISQMPSLKEKCGQILRHIQNYINSMANKRLSHCA